MHPENEDCEVCDNVIVNGGLTINKYKKAVSEGNLILAKGAKRPAGSKSVLLASRYDPGRAHLAVFNWENAKEVQVETKGFLGVGDNYRLFDPKDPFGKPLFEGVCRREAIPVPMSGEFAAFIVLREEVMLK
jgi:hypothetical protein